MNVYHLSVNDINRKKVVVKPNANVQTEILYPKSFWPLQIPFYSVACKAIICVSKSYLFKYTSL